MSNDTRYLVKAVYIYSNGDTAERTWANSTCSSKKVDEVARYEENVVREYTNHYQAFLRIDKPAQGTLGNKELFAQLVNILTKMLLLNVK